MPFQDVQRARIVLYAVEGWRIRRSRRGWTRRLGWKVGGEDGSLSSVWIGSRINRGRVARVVFPPERVAAVKAVACELLVRYGLPLGRCSRTELYRLVIAA